MKRLALSLALFVGVVIVPPFAHAAISRGNTPVVSSFGASPESATYTVASQGLMYAWTYIDQTSAVSNIGVTVNGTSMVSMGTILTPWTSLQKWTFFYLDNATAGSKTVTLSWTGTANGEVIVASWSGGCLDVAGTPVGSTASTISMPLTTTGSADWMVAAMEDNSGNSPTGFTTAWGSGIFDSNGSVGAAGSHSLTWNLVNPYGGVGSPVALMPCSVASTLLTPILALVRSWWIF